MRRKPLGEEDLPKAETNAVSHHLALVALAAVEEDRLAFALHREAGNIAIDRGNRGGSAEESHA